MSQIEQDLKSYEEFCDPDVLVDVIGEGCDLLHKFVDHTKGLQQQLAEKDAEIERLRRELKQMTHNWETTCEAGQSLVEKDIALEAAVRELVATLRKIRRLIDGGYTYSDLHEIDAAIAKHGEAA